MGVGLICLILEEGEERDADRELVLSLEINKFNDAVKLHHGGSSHVSKLN